MTRDGTSEVERGRDTSVRAAKRGRSRNKGLLRHLEVSIDYCKTENLLKCRDCSSKASQLSTELRRAFAEDRLTPTICNSHSVDE